MDYTRSKTESLIASGGTGSQAIYNRPHADSLIVADTHTIAATYERLSAEPLMVVAEAVVEMDVYNKAKTESVSVGDWLDVRYPISVSQTSPLREPWFRT